MVVVVLAAAVIVTASVVAVIVVVVVVRCLLAVWSSIRTQFHFDGTKIRISRFAVSCCSAARGHRWAPRGEHCHHCEWQFRVEGDNKN